MGFKKSLATLLLAASPIFFFNSCDTSTEPEYTPPKREQPTVPENHAPSLNLNCATSSGNEHGFYYCSVSVSDPDGDNISVSISQNPGWIQFYSDLRWIGGYLPEVTQDEAQTFKVRASDGKTSVEAERQVTIRNLSNTYVTTEGSSENHISTFDSSSVTFSNPVNFQAGDQIVADTSVSNEGILREVERISDDGKIVYTKEGNLGKAVGEGEANYVNVITRPEVSSYVGLEGVLMDRDMARDNGFDFAIKLDNVVLYTGPFGGEIIANGNIMFNISLGTNIEIKERRIDVFEFNNHTRVISDISIGSNAVGMAQTRNITLAEYSLSPALFYIGLVPVVITPKLSVGISIDPTKANPLSVRVLGESDLETSLGYSSGSWNATANLDNDFDFENPVFTGDWQIGVYAGPRLIAYLYGIAGPFMGASLGLSLEGDESNWKLEGHMKASVGALTSNVFGRIRPYLKSDLVDYSVVLAQSDTTTIGETVTDTIQPGPEGNDAWINYILYPDGSEGFNSYPDEETLEFRAEYIGSHGYEERSFLRIPLQDIPQGSRVESATLRLYGYAINNSSTDLPTLTLMRLLDSWSESGITWNNQPSYNKISNRDFSNRGTDTWYDFDVTSAVQDWVTNGNNYGFGIFVEENETSGRVFSGDNPDVGRRPMLIVSYEKQ